MNKRVYLLLALGALAIWGMIYFFNHRSGDGPQLLSQAPDFVLEDSQKNLISLSNYKGKAVLLNFWATWCGPCREEMPSIEALYQRYKDRGFVVVGVSLDEEGWGAIDAFLKQVPVTFPILNDAKQSVSEKYQIYRVPETYFIDPTGKIVQKVAGPQNYNQKMFYDLVERILPGSQGR